MKRLLTTIALTLAFVAGAWAENGYRAHFYLPGVFEPGTTKPFVYHTVCIADSEAEVLDYIYGLDPKATVLGIEFMGVATEEPVEPADPDVAPSELRKWVKETFLNK